MRFLLVFLGSGIGGVLRYGVGLAAVRFLGVGFPWGTLAINVAGSALMGLAASLFTARAVPDPGLRLFLTTGILGGFTTWSTFSLDAYALWERGEGAAAIGYVGGSLVLSFVGVAAALHLARQWG